MKKMKYTILLPLIAVVCGAVGLGLRVLLYANGMDEKGMLVWNHPLDIATWVIALAVIALFVVVLRRQTESCEYRDQFPASIDAAIVTFAAAIGCLVLAFQIRGEDMDTLTTLWFRLAILAAASFTVTAWCRLKGTRPLFVFHAVICLFFCIHTVCQYRMWSSNPQVADYGFAVLACVSLVLTALYRTAFDVDMARPRKLRFMSLLAVFFCILSLVGPQFRIFYVFGGVWAISNILPPFVRPREADEKEV